MFFSIENIYASWSNYLPIICLDPERFWGGLMHDVRKGMLIELTYFVCG